VTEQGPPRSRLKQVRILLWLLVALAIVGIAAIWVVRSGPVTPENATNAPAQASFGGPFTLVGGDGKPFSSAKLNGKPFAIYFGFTSTRASIPRSLALASASRMISSAQGCALNWRRCTSGAWANSR
jgi:protein SCO1/2